MKLERGKYRAVMKMNRFSPEILDISVAETFHMGAGSILATDTGEVVRVRRGLR